jgi:hypothetical protein
LIFGNRVNDNGDVINQFPNIIRAGRQNALEEAVRGFVFKDTEDSLCRVCLRSNDLLVIVLIFSH